MGIQSAGPPPPPTAGATTARAPGATDLAEAEAAVTALYQEHALGLVRLGSSLDGFNTLITPDGTKIVCVTGAHNSPGGVATEFSVSTGGIVGILRGEPVTAGSTISTPVQDVLWSSMTGSTLIVATGAGAGVLTADQFTPIPGATIDTPDAAW